MADATLLRLPDEILLKVMGKLSRIPHKRREDLANCSRVCRQLRPVALELLLLEPIVHLFKITPLLKLYFKYPEMAARVTSLELTSQCMCEDPVERPTQSCNQDLKRNTPLVDQTFRDDCKQAINEFARTPTNMKQCLAGLVSYQYYPQATLSVLLAKLPNLKKLLLGTAGLMHIPILGKVLPDNRSTCSYRDCTENEYASPCWEYGYLDDIFIRLAPRLHHLELPFTWSACGLHLASPVHSLEDFTSLKHLTISQEALCAKLSTQTWRKAPTKVLPRTIEVLTVFMKDGGDQHTDIFIKSLVLSRTSFPGLRTIELHSNSFTKVPTRISEAEEKYKLVWADFGTLAINEERKQWAAKVTDESFQVFVYYEPKHTFDKSFHIARQMGCYLGMPHNYGWSVVNVLEVRGEYDELITLREQAEVEEITGFRDRLLLWEKKTGQRNDSREPLRAMDVGGKRGIEYFLKGYLDW